MKIAVVILNWNKAALTHRCLEVARQTTSLPAQWIIVDNGSSEPIGDWPADVIVLRNAANLGFAGGVNVGMRYAFEAGADYVWLLNNDAEPLTGALEALVTAAEADAAIGLASAVILNSDDNDAVDWHGGIWRDDGYDRTTDFAEYQRWEREAPDRIWLLGTALLISRRLVERIGYFDEDLFAYWEDNDISRRSARTGFRNIVVANARVRHSCGKPLELPAARPPYYYYYMTRNELLILRKGRKNLRSYYWMLRHAVRWHNTASLGQPQRRAIRRGFVHGLLGKGGPYRE